MSLFSSYCSHRSHRRLRQMFQRPIGDGSWNESVRCQRCTMRLAGVIHRLVHNSIRVQPEIKMADVKRETLKLDIADGIYVTVQRNPHIFCLEQHSGTNVSKGRRQSEWESKDDGLEAEVDMKERISQLVHKIYSNTIPTAIPMFSMSNNTTGPI